MQRSIASYGRMLASSCTRHRLSVSYNHQTSPVGLSRSFGTKLLIPCQQQQLAAQGSRRLVRSIPEDLDSQLIIRRALSGLEAAGAKQHAPSPPSSSTSSDATPQDTSSSIGSSDAESVATSSVDWEDVQAHKRAAVQQAFLNNTLGFGFSAGGLVFPYYVGLVSQLVQDGVLSRPAQLAGSSAGSLIAASYNAGLDMSTVERSMIEFGEDCLKNGTRYRLGPLLREFLHNYLPPDAHERCSGNTHVAVTRLLPYWRSQMVSHFESRDDLISALMTSCHIPWYFDGRWMTKFRGHYCVDGGVMAFIPTVPDTEYTVKVMCFPSSHLGLIKGATANRKPLARLHSLVDIDITLDAYEDWPYDLQQVLKWALLASAQETSSLLIEKGKRDASAWFEAMELGPLVQQAAAAAGQQPSQQQGGAILASGSSSGGSEQQQQQPQPDWSDDRGQQRQQEAEQAQQKTAAAEAAGAAPGTGPSSAAVVPAVKHAAEVDASGVVGPPNKRHKAATAAATVAAAGKAAADGVGSLLGSGSKGEREVRSEE